MSNLEILNNGKILGQYLPSAPAPHPYVENPMVADLEGGNFSIDNIDNISNVNLITNVGTIDNVTTITAENINIDSQGVISSVYDTNVNKPCKLIFINNGSFQITSPSPAEYAFTVPATGLYALNISYEGTWTIPTLPSALQLGIFEETNTSIINYTTLCITSSNASETTTYSASSGLFTLDANTNYKINVNYSAGATPWTLASGSEFNIQLVAFC